MTVRISRSRLLTASGTVLALRPHNLRAQQPETIRVASAIADDLTPVYYAVETGMYRRAGLDIQVVPAQSGTAATTAVLSGTYEMGKGSVIAALIAHLRGLPLVIAANGVTWDENAPITIAVVAADSPIKTGADMNNKIGCAPALNDLGTLGIIAWVDKNGGDSRTIKWVEIPNSAAAAAVAAHRVDFCTLNEPAFSAGVSAGQVRELARCAGAISPHYSIAVYFANADWAAKHANAVRSYARVTYEAAAYTNTHRTATEKLMAGVTKIPIEVMRKIYRAPSATSSDPRLLQPVIDVAAKYGTIPGRFDAKDAYFS